MDREKLIEEIEAILEQEQITIANTVEEFAKLQKVGITRCNAEALYNANCQVIPNGAVVLTKEEYDKVICGFMDKHNVTEDQRIFITLFSIEIEKCIFGE